MSDVETTPTKLESRLTDGPAWCACFSHEATHSKRDRCRCFARLGRRESALHCGPPGDLELALVADLDFIVRHAPTDERHATWLVDQLRGARFSAKTTGFADLSLDFPSVGELVVLSRDAPVFDLRSSGRLRCGIRIDDVVVSQFASVEVDVTIAALDNQAAAAVLRAVAKRYEPVLAQVRRIALDQEVKRRAEAARTQSRAFLSYRREDRDSFHTTRAIRRHLGLNRVFWDRESLRPGVDFAAAIEHELNSCAVLLALIGPLWARDANGCGRLEREDDWVRVEVGIALRRSDVVVIPVLMAGASVPGADELPSELALLPGRQHHELSDSSWDADFRGLMTFVEQQLG